MRSSHSSQLRWIPRAQAAPSSDPANPGTTTTMAELKLESISKGFGITPVLGSIDLNIEDGEFLTLVGPSG